MIQKNYQVLLYFMDMWVIFSLLWKLNSHKNPKPPNKKHPLPPDQTTQKRFIFPY